MTDAQEQMNMGIPDTSPIPVLVPPTDPTTAPPMAAYIVPTTLAGMLALANQIEQLLADNGGELTPEVESLMLANGEVLPAKVDATVFILKRMEAAEQMFKDEADRYAKVAKGLAGSQTRLKAYVKNGMLERGLTELAGEANRFAIQPMADKLVIQSVDKLPDEYTIPVIGREPNNTLIRQQLEAGVVIDGASLEPVKAMKIYAVKKVKETKAVKAAKA
jgi:Siphovirus Gp157